MLENTILSPDSVLKTYNIFHNTRSISSNVEEEYIENEDCILNQEQLFEAVFEDEDNEYDLNFFVDDLESEDENQIQIEEAKDINTLNTTNITETSPKESGDHTKTNQNTTETCKNLASISYEIQDKNLNNSRIFKNTEENLRVKSKEIIDDTSRRKSLEQTKTEHTSEDSKTQTPRKSRSAHHKKACGLESTQKL
jgi:hypothetical protein